MFIARTRFSLFLPNAADWIVTRNNEEINAYKESLFEKTRLDFRINFISTITLPLLERATANEDFLHVIEYSAYLPSPYINILKDLEKKYDFVKLLRYDEKGVPEADINDIAIKHFYLNYVDKDIWIGRFMLDDDDCISLNYFEAMKPYLNENFETFYISSGKGAVGLFDENYVLELVSEIYEPKINIGFLNVGRYSHIDKKLIFNEVRTRHSRMDEVNRVVLDSRNLSFFWSRHPLQDTRSNKNNRTVRALLARLEALPKFCEEEVAIHFGEDFYEKLLQLHTLEDTDLDSYRNLKNIENSNEVFEFDPYVELGLEEKVRLVINDDSTAEVILIEVIDPKQTYTVSYNRSQDVHNYKYKYQVLESLNSRDKWVNYKNGYTFLVDKL